jgi:hypothetical protein
MQQAGFQTRHRFCAVSVSGRDRFETSILDSVKEKHRFIFSETSGDALVALGREALTSGQLANTSRAASDSSNSPSS